MKFSKILLTTGLGVVIFTFNVQAVTPAVIPCGLELVNGVWQRAKDFWCPPNFTSCQRKSIGIDGCTTDIARVQRQSDLTSCSICIS